MVLAFAGRTLLARRPAGTEPGSSTVWGAIIGGRDPNFSGLDKDNASVALNSEATINYDGFVPEPAMVSLLTIGCVGLIYRKRK